jgi:phosphoserine phosphatase
VCFLGGVHFLAVSPFRAQQFRLLQHGLGGLFLLVRRVAEFAENAFHHDAQFGVDGFTLADFRACAKSALMKRGRAEAIVEEVRAAVTKWPDYAEQAQVMLAKYGSQISAKSGAVQLVRA